MLLHQLILCSDWPRVCTNVKQAA